MVELSCEGDFRFANSFSKGYAGDAFNTAIGAARLGSQVAFITRVGDDPFSYDLTRLFREERLETPRMRSVPGGKTGLYFSPAVGNRANREFLYYRDQSAASKMGPEDIDPLLIKKAKVVFATGVTLGISKSARKAVQKAFKIARDNNVMTVFDPNYRARLWDNEAEAFDVLIDILPYVDVILPSVPNDTYATIGLHRPDQVIDFFHFKDIKLIIVKAGEEGCYLAYKRNTQHIPAMRVQEVDTVGAGDAFNAGVIHGLVEGRSLTDCAQLGITTAGLKIQGRGTIQPLPNRDSVYSRAFSAAEFALD